MNKTTFKSFISPTILIFVTICCVVFVVTSIVSGVLHAMASDIHKPLTMVSSIFAHINYSHLFWNMLAILFWGGILGYLVGERKLLFIIVMCGIAEVILYSLLVGNSSVGSSGVVYIVFSCSVMLIIKRKLLHPLLNIGLLLCFLIALSWYIYFREGVAWQSHIIASALGVTVGVCVK